MNDSLLPSRPLRVFSVAASALWWLLVAFWVVLALAWGALHGWIVPRIGELRPQLEIQATRALGIPVRIGAVSARSDGLVPTFELRDVVLHDPQAREALRLARVVVAMSPRSLWHLGFEQIVVDGPQLDLRRTADGRIHVAGIDISGDGEDPRAANWFFRQKEVLVRGGTVRWTDELRGAPVFELRDVQFISRNSPRRHALRFDATPPEAWGQRFSVRGVFRQPLLSTQAGRWRDWTGQAHVDAAALDLSLLQTYAEFGTQLRDGRGAVRAWFDIEQGRLVGGAADVALRQVRAQLAPDRPVLALEQLSGRLSGKRLAHGFELETQGLQFQGSDGRRWPGGNVALSWQDAHERQPQQVRLRADRLDLAALTGIAGHLPLEPAAQAWLARHRPAGLVESVEAGWTRSPAQPARYEARGRVVGLGIAGGGELPGLRGASVDFDLSQSGGKASVRLQDGALELTGILHEPLVPVQRLQAQLQWRLSGDRIALEATDLEFRNADLRAQGRASWRTGAQGARLPGVLDLQVGVDHAEGTRVWRYLPLVLGPEVRDYVRESVLAGKASEGRIRVRGDLRDFPFADARSGEFRISAKVRDAVYAFAPPSLVPPDKGQWPALTQLSGELLFERNGMQVRGAQGRFAGPAGLQVQADASIADLAASIVHVTGQVRGPLAESVALFNSLPVAHWIGQPLAQASADGPTDLRLRLALPLARMEGSRVQGSLALRGNELQVRPDVPRLSQLRGSVAFTETGFSVSGAQARARGGELRIDGGTRVGGAPDAAPVELRLQGTASAQALARELGWLTPLARRTSGSAAYTATLGVRPGGIDLQVASDLQGLALDLPAPLDKPAAAALPLRFEMGPVAAARPMDQFALQLGTLASVTYQRDLSGPSPRVLRGAIGVGLSAGEAAPLPPTGVLANIRLDRFSVDAWQEVLQALAPGAGGAAPAAGVMDYLPTILAVRARELTAQGRTLDRVVVGGSREGLVWRANVDAEQLNGYVEYRQASDSNPGRVLARLARLSIAAGSAGEVESLLDEDPSSIPALDVVVDEFELRGRPLGRLEIDAVNQGSAGGRAPEWRLNRLSLSLPEAVFSASGRWAGAAPRERRRTVMDFRLDIRDSGLLLARLGMQDVVRRGRGQLEGQVAWTGSPLSLDIASLNGNMAVAVESGQFMKAEPGLAKLLGVLSLQSLPRRLTLDFRDVFSEGFAFDFVRGHVEITQGVASTNNLQMKGVNAAVLMDGRADLARETQDLRVLVVPEINAGTASLVATVINPAIGLGTFLAQMFLREPLMRAATQEFHIDGTWGEPRVTRVPRRPESRPLREAHAPASAAQGQP